MADKTPIDPAVIIRKCDEALKRAEISIQMTRKMAADPLGEWPVERHIRAARDMIKRHGYG